MSKGREDIDMVNGIFILDLPKNSKGNRNQQKIIPDNQTRNSIPLQCQKETNKQVRIALVVTE